MIYLFGALSIVVSIMTICISLILDNNGLIPVLGLTNTNSGQTQMKDGYRYLKEGYIDGFLAGFAYKITGDKDL